MAEYTDKTYVKDDLGIVGTSKDALITRYIKSVSKWIDNQIGGVGFTLANDDYDEYYDIKEVPRKRIVFTKHRPINSITQIDVKENTIASDNYELYDNYVYIYGIVVGRKAVRIQYNAGYKIDWDNVDDANLHNLPEDIEMITRTLVVEAYNKRAGGANIKQETIGAWTRSYFSENENQKNMINEVINLYKIY